MRRDRQELIANLAADVGPVRRPGRIGVDLAVWLAVAVVYSIVVILAAGPLRPGALRALVAYPAFAVETLLAVTAVGAVAYAAIRSSIPGAPPRSAFVALVLLGAWAAVYVVGLRFPAHPVSTLGERPYCIWQTVAFSLPTLGLMLWAVRRRYPLEPRRSAALAGAAAASIPAAIMQFACMYVPAHILTHHLGPVVLTALIGAVLGPLVATRPVGRRA